MSIALKVGLGVGLSVGVPLVLIAGIFAGLCAARQRRAGAGRYRNYSEEKLAAANKSQLHHSQEDNFDAFAPAPRYQETPPEFVEANGHAI
jgi:hypothetical protein